jgi:hypothetical protein
MIKYFVAVLVLPLFIYSNAFSQFHDSLLAVYKSQTIYRYGYKFLKGREKLTYSDLRLEFSTRSTQEMYKKSKTKLFFSKIFNVASLGLIVASVVTKTTINGSIGFAAGTGLLGLCGIYYQTQSSKYLDAAIWERNKDALFKTGN